MTKSTEITLHGIAPTPLPHSQLFLDILIKKIKEVGENEEIKALTLNFKDTSYTPYDGGYHPVEIRLSKLSKQGSPTVTWQLEYITDFAYQGGPFPELARDIDFDFANGCFYSIFLGWKPLKGNADATELYKLWESNFINYLKVNAFDSVNIKAD